MCGIVGYTGERQAVGVLLEALAQLEYRGYDSIGICPAGAGGSYRVRADANLSALRTLVDDLGTAPAAAGIGHTRWTTHGEVPVPTPTLSSGATAAPSPSTGSSRSTDEPTSKGI